MTWPLHFPLEELLVSGDHAQTPPEETALQIHLRLQELAHALEIIRAACGDKPITVCSGYRTPAYNRSIGGAEKSQHMRGTAADIRVKGMSPEKVADRIDYLQKCGALPPGGLGRYPRFTHVDVRGTLARWVGSRGG